MAIVEKTLEDLRREIDEIDAAMHDLLMRRAELADAIGQAKTGSAGIVRPAREAIILRRLMARHKGRFPKQVVVHIWREIISALTSLQGDLSVAVHSSNGGELRELARDHFGSQAPLLGFESTHGVIRAITEGEATIGVLPLPQSEERDPWWPRLASKDDQGPRIAARLPFVASETSASALVVGNAPFESSGNDSSYLIAEAREHLSRSSLKTLLDQARLPVREIQSFSDSGRNLALLEVTDYVPAADDRITGLLELSKNRLERVWSAGGFAHPLSVEELA